MKMFAFSNENAHACGRGLGVDTLVGELVILLEIWCIKILLSFYSFSFTSLSFLLPSEFISFPKGVSRYTKVTGESI